MVVSIVAFWIRTKPETQGDGSVYYGLWEILLTFFVFYDINTIEVVGAEFMAPASFFGKQYGLTT